MWFSSYKPHSIPIKTANGEVVYSAGIGSVRFKPSLDTCPASEVVFHNVLHVPQLQSSLLSILYLSSKKNWKIIAERNSIDFFFNDKCYFTASVQANLAYLDGYVLLTPESHALNTSSLLPLTLELWHRRFAHINYTDLKSMVSKGLVTGLKLDSSTLPDPVCEPCIAGKQHRTVNKSATRCKVPLGVVHTDLHGPMPVATPEGYKYFMIFVDDATRLWAVYLLNNKSEAAKAFLEYKAYIEKATGHQIKVLHDDKEGGLSSNAFNDKLKEFGITRRFTMRAEPHSNGVAERAIRSIANDSTSLLHQAHLPASFWGKAVGFSVNKHNRTPTSANNGQLPFTAMFGEKPDVSLFRVFGSLAYVHIKKDKRSGFSPHMEKAIFVGFPVQSKGWEFFNPITKKFILSDQADFDERVFPRLRTRLPDPPLFPPSFSDEPSPSSLVQFIPDDDDQPHKQVGDLVGDVDDPDPLDPIPDPVPLPPAPAPLPAPHIPAPAPLPVPPPAPEPAIRRSGRSKVPTDQWRQNWFKADYRPEQHRVPPPPAPIPAPQQYRDPPAQIPSSDDDSNSDSDGNVSSSQSEHNSEQSELLAVQSAYFTIPEALEVAFKAGAFDDSPKSYAEAMTRPDAQKWHEAACQEIDSLLENGTWELAQLPPGRKAIGSRWVFLIKCKSDGSVDRYKARLVAKGFSQRPGFDFDETYAATVKYTTLRTILALGALEDLEIESVDISSAFLNGDIDAEVYMQQPEGFPQGPIDSVLKLIKSLYGLRQSPRLWHKKLNSVLTKLGFVKIKSDASVWVYHRDGIRIIVPVFVDDLTLVSKSKKKIQELKDELKKHFKLRDLGPTEFLLGIKVERDRSKRTLHLSQHQYTLDILKRFDFDNCSPVSTPLNPGIKLSKDQCPKTPAEVEAMRSIPYAHAVGSLMYLAISTRPDIAYSVGVLSRFSANPGLQHWAAVKHLFRYLKGTLDYKLIYCWMCYSHSDDDVIPCD